MTAWVQFVRARLAANRDGGTAIIELVFVAVVVMVPLVYLIIAVASVQGSQLAVAEAAREAGRAYATADTTAQADQHARAAVRIALADHQLPDDANLHYVPVGKSCVKARQITPRLQPGTQFVVCVVRIAALPGVPRVLLSSPVTSVGEYVVHIDDYRAAG